ncbi:MAG: HD domain-containing phosphohydrolase [Burkholderiaceae bacterium]
MEDTAARLRAIQARASALAAEAPGRVAEDMLIELDALQRELVMLDSVGTEGYVTAVFAVVAGFNAIGRAQRMGALMERAISICRKLPDRRLLRRALSLYGYFTGDVSNAPAALQSLLEAVELVREMDDPVAEVSTVVNLGVMLTNVGWDDDARRAFQCAWNVYEQNPEAFEGIDTNGASAILMAAAAAANTAAIFSQLNEVERGLEFSARARTLAQGQGVTPQHQTVLLHYDHIHCILLAKAGRLTEAARIAEAMLATAEGSGNVRWECLAWQAAGFVSVRQGKVGEGLVMLKKARERAAAISTGMELPAHLYLADAYRYVGQATEAFQLTRGVLELMKNAQRAHFNRAQSVVGQSLEKNVETRIAALENLAAAAEAKQDPSGEHTIRVGVLARLICNRLPKAVDLLNTIERAARLHDAGKSSLPETLLRMQGPVTPQERELLKTHARAGEKLIREQLGDERGAVFARVARSHHEWFDGTGYPDALAGERIPLEARIVAAADAYDSLTHERPWRKAIPHDEARIFMFAEKGTQFDPAVVDTLLQIVKELRADGRTLDDQLIEMAERSELVAARRSLRTLLRT